MASLVLVGLWQLCQPGLPLIPTIAPRIFAGGYDGYVYKLDQTTRTHNNTSINYNWTTPFLSYGVNTI